MDTDTIEGFRLSPQQEQLWRALHDDPAYVAVVAVLLEGKLDGAALHAAVVDVADRHEILRTTFHRRAGIKVPFQVIGEVAAPSWVELDRQGVDVEAVVDEAIRDASRRALDLGRGPLLHVSRIALAEDRHVLVAALPSLAADASTLVNLAREVRHFYGERVAGLSGGGDALAADPLQYADFSEWQNELMTAADDESAEGRAYWGARTATGVAPAMLPFEKQPFATSLLEIGSVEVHVPSGLLTAFDAPARAIVLAAFQAWLSRVVGDRDVTVACVLDGRGHEEQREAFGLFAKSVLLSRRLEPSQPFIELVADVARALDDAVKWQDHAPATPSAPTGGAAFELLDDVEIAAAGGVSFSLLRATATIGRFGFKLACRIVGGTPSFALQHDRRAHERDDVVRAAESFSTFLASAAGSPGATIAELASLTDADRAVHAAVNETRTVLSDACLPELFEEHVARTPDRDALAFAGERLTYAALNARANRLARLLRARGVGADTRVGLCVERSLDMIVALLAILKAGGAYVPLLPEHPKARLAHQLAEVEAPLLLATERQLDRLPAFGGDVLCIDRDRALFDSLDATNLEPLHGPDHLAYVIYTSGSTGLPKGVGVSHRNLANYTRFMLRRLGLAAASEPWSFATVSTIAADLGNTCVFPSLASGGCLHVIPHEVSIDDRLFADYCAASPIDVLKITPSHLGALLAAGEGRRILPRRWLVTGGEALSWELCARIHEAGTCELLNHYGPTETTIGSLTYGPVRRDDAAHARAATVPIGRPIANTHVFVLDERRTPVPIGAPGELYIGGTGVARGYLNQSAQTADRFIASPFSVGSGARLYRTGDRVRHLPDGSLEFLGRVDHQVKIRGFRVEPAEVEAALQADAGVRQAVVTVVKDARGDPQLVAYVVPAKRPAPTVEQLRTALLEHLPDYMVPTVFVKLEALPLTPNGKVDRGALPAPEHARALDGEVAPPRNELEAKVVRIWSEVLRAERVGVNDDFFELGGHSLLATQVISRVRTEFRVELSLNTLFEGPTVAQLAAAITACEEQKQKAELDRMLAELDGMSEEEAQRLLEEQAGT